jgi:hypothetical protein
MAAAAPRSDAFAHEARNDENDWRVAFGIGVTVVWIVLGYLYISNIVGWGDFVQQNAPSLGSFLEGAFAPLAFLWLVVGFFLQQKQLAQNTKAVQQQYLEMRRSVEQAEIQSRAIAANELHVRQDIFLKTMDAVERQLGMIAGYLCLSYDQDVAGELVGDEAGELFRQMGLGDPQVFSRRALVAYYGRGHDVGNFLFGTAIRTRHTRRFMEVYERLVDAAADSDPFGILIDALHDNSHGRLYRVMKEAAGRLAERESDT